MEQKDFDYIPPIMLRKIIVGINKLKQKYPNDADYGKEVRKFMNELEEYLQGTEITYSQFVDKNIFLREEN